MLFETLNCISYAAPDEFVGTVGALSLSVRFLGGSIGTSIFFNVFNNKFAANFPKYVGEAAVRSGADKAIATNLVLAYASGVAGAPAKVAGVTDAMLAATQYASQMAFAESLKWVWITTIPFGIVSCICCVCLPNIRKFMTSKIAVDLH